MADENITSTLAPETLSAIHRAALAITAELSLPRVLEAIVKTAKQLVGVRYAALGVPGPNGKLEQFITEGMSEEEVSHMSHLPEGKGLLGHILTTTETIRLDDMAASPYSYGFTPHHPIMHSFQRHLGQNH